MDLERPRLLQFQSFLHRGPATRPCCIQVSADGQDDVVVDDFTRPVRIDSRDAELVDHRNTASRAIPAQP